MRSNLEQFKNEALGAIQSAESASRLDELENKFFGRAQGEITKLMKGLKNISLEERQASGERLNQVKSVLGAAIIKKRDVLENIAWEAAAETERIDITEPALPIIKRGHSHPVTVIQRSLEDLFTSLGYMVLDGPELESDYYNFTALNIPE